MSGFLLRDHTCETTYAYAVCVRMQAAMQTAALQWRQVGSTSRGSVVKKSLVILNVSGTSVKNHGKRWMQRMCWS
jgi:hypothetical protein